MLLGEGEQQAFAEIYNRYWDKLLAIAFNHTRDTTVAEDIVQNIFVNLWERRNSLQIANLEHYLAVAAKFAVFKEYYRKQKREAGMLDRLSVRQEEAIDEQINAKFLEEYIYGIVEQLPQKCRLVFQYSRIKHLNISEISGKMGITTKTVEAHLTKALKAIRQELGESGIHILLLALLYSALLR
jgi:RNA polymerase sigma-70 factor (ECF subfamily)